MAKQQKPLTIPCAEISHDHMVVADEPDHRLVTLNTSESDVTAALSLNEDTARQLFNWLGIWLHQH